MSRHEASLREVTANSLIYEPCLFKGVCTIPTAVDVHARGIALVLGLKIDHIEGNFDKIEYVLSGEITEEQAEGILEAF